ncbi:MAG: CYTH domain-containing protein, partial [Caulobacteraceae bacterium]
MSARTRRPALCAHAWDPATRAAAGQSPEETELKFRLGVEVIARLRASGVLGGSGRTATLRSVYYDTPDRDLWSAGVSLRVREEDGAFVQTVKSGGASGA